MTAKKIKRQRAFEKGEKARAAERQVGLDALKKVQINRERQQHEQSSKDNS